MGRRTSEEETSREIKDGEQVEPVVQPKPKNKLPKGARIVTSVCSVIVFIVTIIGSVLGSGA